MIVIILYLISYQFLSDMLQQSRNLFYGCVYVVSMLRSEPWTVFGSLNNDEVKLDIRVRGLKHPCQPSGITKVKTCSIKN